MKALGIVRKIDDLGRLVIPKEVRDSQGWASGQAMEMFMSDEGLVVKAYRSSVEKENAAKILKRTLAFVKGGPDLALEEELLEVISYIEGQK